MKRGMRFRCLLVTLAFVTVGGCVNHSVGSSFDFNAELLAAVKTMPTGGGYDGSDRTKNLLHTACEWQGDKIEVRAEQAKPSFCSGATYLLLLEALNGGKPSWIPEIDHQDGHGMFGRWNANGPGAAKLVADIGAGKNFTSWDEARPGDFLKIWW
ncbi:MAG: hypothetical protein ACQKBU_10525, partial [Verrucomicrobiales bacterium]